MPGQKLMSHMAKWPRRRYGEAPMVLCDMQDLVWLMNMTKITVRKQMIEETHGTRALSVLYCARPLRRPLTLHTRATRSSISPSA